MLCFRRKTNLKQRAQLLMLSFFIVQFSGCAAVMVGTAAGVAGAYVWAHGNLELTANYPAEKLYDASRDVLDQMGFMIERDRHNRFNANISGRTPGGQRVLIRIEGQSEFSSRIQIRIGMWGDREQSQILLNRILRNV